MFCKSPHCLALGLAIGVAMAFVPIPGLHPIAAILLAMAFRANIITAFVGSALGNPWLFGYIWVGTKHMGELLVGHFPHAGDEYLNYDQVFASLWESVLTFNFSALSAEQWDIWSSMLRGGLFEGLLFGGLLYLLMKRALLRLITV